MKIAKLIEATVPTQAQLRSAGFDFTEMTTSVVAVVSDVVRNGKPVTGYAFNSTGRYACGAQMRDRFFPRLMAAKPQDLLDKAGTNFSPEKAFACMMQREKAGGHSERSYAIGTIEIAFWDLVAKIEERPLWRVLADRFGNPTPRDKVPTYVGGGWYQPGDTVERLQDELKANFDRGYRRFKIKIGGASLAEDLRRIEGALKVVGSGDKLAVDANGRFDRETAFAYADGMAPYGLAWFEEFTEPVDFELMAEVAARYPHPLATGENLFSVPDARNLARHGGLRPDKDILQFDPPQSYGIGSLVTTMRTLAPYGWGALRYYPHGGNQMTLACVGGLGLGGCEAFAAFGAFSGFADEVKLVDGDLTLPTLPGAGFEGQPELFKIMTTATGTG